MTSYKPVRIRCRNRPTFGFQWLYLETATLDNTGTFHYMVHFCTVFVDAIILSSK